MRLATVAKFLTAVVGAAAEAANAGLLPANIARWVGIGIAVATALGVYAVPNTQTAGPVVGQAEALALQVAQHLHLLGASTPAGAGATSPAPVPAGPTPIPPPPAASTEGPH